MSEVYVQLMLELPGDRADEISRILRAVSTSPGPPGGGDIFSHYGRLGAGVEDVMRESAAKRPKWVDPELTPAEALIIQAFSRRGNNVLIEFMVGDEGSSRSGWAEGTGDHLIMFVSRTLAMAGVKTIDSLVYNENELEDLYDEILTLGDEGSGPSPLEDEYVVVTGKFPGYSREDMEDFARDSAGRCRSRSARRPRCWWWARTPGSRS